MDHLFLIVCFVVVVALIFDFINGFHDAANAISTIVISRTLTPLQAVLMAAAAEFVGYFFFGVAVAKMIGKNVVHLDHITIHLLIATLLGAIIWNLITWYFGIPTSSSHALIGGLIGAGISQSGMGVVVWGWSGVLKIFVFIMVAPCLGLLGALVTTTVVLWLCRKSVLEKMNRRFRHLQLVSAAFYCVGHGTNDAQKTMGIIALALYTAGYIKTFDIPHWVVFSAYIAIALGTFSGGWRIVKTMGTKITRIRQMEGFCAESAAACVLIGTAHFGIPVSTTHVIAGSIMGVGAVENAAKVRWVTARKIIWAWFLTIPAAAAFSALSYLLLRLTGISI